MKKSSGVVGIKHKRWFEIKGGKLRYGHVERSKEMKEVCDVGREGVKVEDVGNGMMGGAGVVGGLGGGYWFNVVVDRRKVRLMLCADSEREKEDWVRAIKSWSK
eukprot:TRINITY_DN7094_c0_g1_i2.p2 TRINITY_DN7094_c0_g1~~TRINITY_DN7094_c0_g1_i2.p2  ORF type:complete len:104 (-),score=46.89 TRINITY_DN7094_c0_g1_i2:16-327(-)